MAAKNRMETLTARVAAPPPLDWLDRCAFTSRHRDLPRRAPVAVLTKKPENALPPQVQAARERVIFPMIDRALDPLTKSLLPVKEIQVLPAVPAPSALPVVPSVSSASTTESLRPPNKPRRLPDPIVAELHSFRQLSSPLFCPETSLDTLPEYILFALVALLAVAWPILAMLGVMSGVPHPH